MAKNPFEVGDKVRIGGGKNLSINGREATVIRIINLEMVEIDLGFDPIWESSTRKAQETVKYIIEINRLQKL